MADPVVVLVKYHESLESARPGQFMYRLLRSHDGPRVYGPFASYKVGERFLKGKGFERKTQWFGTTGIPYWEHQTMPMTGDIQLLIPSEEWDEENRWS